MAKPTKPRGRRPRRRNARTSPTAWRTSRARSTTRSSPSPTPRATSSPGASAGNVGFKELAQVHAVRRPAGGRGLCQEGHGARGPQGRRPGEGARFGPGDRHPLAGQAVGIEVVGIKDVTPIPHNGCRPEAAPGLGRRGRGTHPMARYTRIHVCRLCRREPDQAVLEGRGAAAQLKCPVSEAVTDRHSRAYPPGEHGRDRMRQGSEYLAQLRGRSRPPPHLRHPREAVPQHVRGGQPPGWHHRWELPCATSSSASTTSCSGPAGCQPPPKPASSCATAT